MSTKELKNKLIDKIEHLDDNFILDEIYQFLETKEESNKNLTLTNELKNAIDAGLDDVKNGKIVTHENAKKEISRWLSK